MTESEPHFEIVEVTPELATEWLDRNTRNRKVRPARLRQYTQDMVKGNWAMTGEPIKLDPDGNVLDGQHRLLAVQDAGVPVKMLVARGIAPAAQDVMDTGAARLASDQLRLHGYPQYAILAGAARWAVLWDSDRFYGERLNQVVTHSDILEYVEKNPLLVEISRVAHGMSGIEMTPSARALAMYLCFRMNADAASTFFARLEDGAELPKGSPILALRKRLNDIRVQRLRLTVEQYLSLTIRAWNAWRERKSMQTIPLQAYGANIRVPEIHD